MTEFFQFLGRHALLSGAFFGVLVLWLVYEIRRSRVGYATLASAAATMLVNRENAAIIDVNPAPDFDKGHIVGARNVPLSQFDPEAKDLAKVREQPVLLVCRDGLSSAQAAAKLVKAGFAKVHVLKGGLASWAADQLPLTKGRH
jgi:rhodanese-related sulfurtransferase